MLLCQLMQAATYLASNVLCLLSYRISIIHIRNRDFLDYHHHVFVYFNCKCLDIYQA